MEYSDNYNMPLVCFKKYAQSFYCRSKFFLSSLVPYPAKCMNRTYYSSPRAHLRMQREAEETLR